MYKLFPNAPWGAANQIMRIADKATIPFDPDNTDYQKYLEWVAEGNEPLPADE